MASAERNRRDATGDGFAIEPELASAIDRAAEWVRGTSHLMALTGAGLSVESGIPPFRGPGGLWTKYGEPPMDGYQRFLADPAAAWRERLEPKEPWARGLRDTLAAARPNAGHRAVLEIHGNHRLLRCMGCHTRFDPQRFPVDPERLPPTCPECGGLVKGDTVQFGEPIPPDVLRRCYEEVERCDGMLVIGTTASVYPAAELPYEVLRRGGFVVEVNPHESELSHAASLSLRGPGGVVLTRLVERVRGARAARPEDRS
ncbi:MAG: Sir2 family NAD-dependent protein deacetylase [Myxococcota bacterium]|nr:Sir2 family NAD-dependent protein deacetylase [Myxococcota bacterium]